MFLKESSNLFYVSLGVRNRESGRKKGGWNKHSQEGAVCISGDPGKNPSFCFLFSFVFVVLGFELGASHLLGRHSTT
jgi:hypothetical protein